jgi:hypothetical protein
MKDDTHSIDLAVTDYEQWLHTLFDHPVPAEDLHGPHWHDGLEFEVSDAIILLQHLTRMCHEMKALDERFRVEQIDQGLWLLFGGQVRFVQTLLDAGVSSAMRRDCIRSMYDVFAIYARSLRETPSGIEMWWDHICHDFWASEVQRRICPVNPAEVDLEKLLREVASAMKEMNREAADAVKSPQSRRAYMADNAAKCRAMFSQLTVDERDLLDVIFETLGRILELPDSRSQQFALHGLGHLNHPAVPALVENYLKAHGDSLSEEQRQYARDAAQGMVM